MRPDGFTITVASEVMAILCLASNLSDLKKRLGSIHIAYRYDKTPVFARDINAAGAMTALLRDALQPNLVQTVENSPCVMHGGPFANIAHGCNSVRATAFGLANFDYCITEAGFGSDLGAEKFFDIKCRLGGFTPSCTVLVATVRALKYNGGVAKADLAAENTEALEKGVENLRAHITNMKKFGIPVVVALNVFATDTEAEKDIVRRVCEEEGVPFEYSYAHGKGGEGTEALAAAVLKECEKESSFRFIYEDSATLEEKINALATEIYGADGFEMSATAKASLAKIRELGFDKMPICMAKTQYSLSDDPTKLCRPSGFKITVGDMKACTGAGFLVLYLGNILTMPGLPKKPAAEFIDVDEDGNIIGIF